MRTMKKSQVGLLVLLYTAVVVGCAEHVAVDQGLEGEAPDDFVTWVEENEALSQTGRYVAFSSEATNLVEGDTNQLRDVFRRDLITGTTLRASISSTGLESNGYSGRASISSNGRYVAFSSNASNLVAGDSNGEFDVFVHDFETGLTRRVSVSSNGEEGNSGSFVPSIDDSGRYVVFESRADNLVSTDHSNDHNGGISDVFLHDVQQGTTELVSRSTNGSLGEYHSKDASISGDGNFIVYESQASDLVEGIDVNGGSLDVFLFDRIVGTTELISISSDGMQGNASSFNPAISNDGRFVTFASRASNLVLNDTNKKIDIFVHDRINEVTERVSWSVGGGQVTKDVRGEPAISQNGRYISFRSSADTLVPRDSNNQQDIFVFDRENEETVRASTDVFLQGRNIGSHYHSISGDGRHLVYMSGGRLWARRIHPPQIYEIMPNRAEPGSTVQLRINGSHFEGLVIVEIMDPNNEVVVLQPTSTTKLNDSIILVTLEVPAEGLGSGLYRVRVRSVSDLGIMSAMGECTGCFGIGATPLFQPEWKTGNLSSCSSTCGTGIRAKAVWCEDAHTKRILSKFYCDRDSKPESEVSCIDISTCRYGWETGVWGSCSGSCGSTGTQSRNVWCERTDGATVADSYCADDGEKPATSQLCDTHCNYTFFWRWSSWGSCSGACGTTGTQSRNVWCERNDGVTVSDNFCSGAKPDTSRSCTNEPCQSNKPDLRIDVKHDGWNAVVRVCNHGNVTLNTNNFHARVTGSAQELEEPISRHDVSMAWYLPSSLAPGQCFQPSLIRFIGRHDHGQEIRSLTATAVIDTRGDINESNEINNVTRNGKDAPWHSWSN